MINKLLLVEGSTDKYSIECIHQDVFGTATTFNVQAYKGEGEGIEALLRKLPVIIKGAEVTDVLGVVVDADTNTAGRWHRIKTILIDAGYGNPTDHFPDGLIIPTINILPRFGLWIMPNNQDVGILENFIQSLIHDSDRLQPKVEEVLQNLNDEGLRLFTDVKKPKAFISTWLAWQESPGMSFGSAINKRVFTTDSELCSRFTGWLNTLFNT